MNISSLTSRVLIAIISIPVLILLILHKNPVYYYIVVSVCVMFALIEFFAMMSKRGIRPMWITGILFGVSFLLYPEITSVDYSSSFLTLAVLVALLIKVLRGEYEIHVPSLFITIFGIVYICWLGNFIIQVRYFLGTEKTLFLFLFTWINDSGAYFIGSTIGTHKLFPKVSPKKTVEGFIGGIAFSVLTGIIAKPFLNISNISGTTWICFCLLLSFAAHAGDLGESLLKRFARVGNSFDLIPGHGGILDKIDSLLFASPIFYLFFK